LKLVPLISDIGLTEKVLQSELSECDAEAQVCFFLGKHVIFFHGILFVDMSEVTALNIIDNAKS